MIEKRKEQLDNIWHLGEICKGWAPFSSAKVLRLCKSRGKSCLEISSAKRATCLSSNQTLNEKCEFYVNHLESIFEM